ncbi:hypothetical protein [Rhodococcus sp. HNM0569]|uniref:hypothetical protein n=1 Tax=Rhodococcus sp. HNM0569 TaxID=2716340 RepID=UPI001469B5AC|nr:hypothetical protein [Rhodococcus sp. HNM0569]
MFVLTIDQRGSRRDVDRVGSALDRLRDVPTVRPFMRTAGDELQGVLDDAGVVVDVALACVELGRWSVGIGIGTVETPLPRETRAGRGPAFESARVAVERAKHAPGRIAVAGSDAAAAAAENADIALALVASLVARRSPEGHEAVAHQRAGHSQAETARRLGISKQAVSQRLQTAGWSLEAAGRTLAERLLEDADT